MTSYLKKVTCPTCHTTYQLQLDKKGIKHDDEAYQLACHACGTVWTPVTTTAESPQTQVPEAAPPAMPKPQTPAAPIGRKVNVTPQQPQAPIAPPPQPTWTPPPAYAPPPQPFVPPQPLTPTTKSAGSTIGLIILGTCITMGCAVAVLRNKESNLLSWLTKRQPTISAQPSPTASEELTIRDVRFDVQQSGQRQTILVVGMIDNTTTRAFTLHPLQVSVWGPANQEGVSPTAPKDKNGDCLLISWQHPFDVLHLDTGQSRPFQTVGSIPANLKISRVDVTLP